MGRRSIWSQDAIIELSQQFVAATDEVWRLQNGTDPECKHFQKIADVGHYRAHESTRQGIYICTPSGILLGSMNTHNANAVRNMMSEALRKYAVMDQDERRLPKDADIKPDHRWEESYPADGLDLTMIARDLPESCNPDDECQSAWNKDRIWFSKSEMQQFLPEDLSQVEAGTRYDLPEGIVNRIVRFSVIDTAKGQTSYYARKEVAESRISATVESVDAVQVRIRLDGKTRATSPTSRGREFPHGIETELLGHAVFDRKQQQFSELEFVALGKRWGRTVFNGRHRQLEESPIGFVFRLTPKDAPLIAPSFLFAYRANWIKRP